MNIKGLQLLNEKGLPVIRSLFIFRGLSEISKEHINKYGDSPVWAIRGFDDRLKINASPYIVKNFRIHEFSKDELKEKFDLINSKLEEINVPKENRIFFICEYFSDAKFSGHAIFKDDFIYIDILNANRPSQKDWTPDVSFKIKMVNGRPLFAHIEENKYEDYLAKICKDIIKFNEGAYIDFTLLRDGYFFYHDLSFH